MLPKVKSARPSLNLCSYYIKLCRRKANLSPRALAAGEATGGKPWFLIVNFGGLWDEALVKFHPFPGESPVFLFHGPHCGRFAHH
jgi:hypothetical protein